MSSFRRTPAGSHAHWYNCDAARARLSAVVTSARLGRLYIILPCQRIRHPTSLVLIPARLRPASFLQRMWDVIHTLLRLDQDVIHSRVGRIGVARDSRVALDYTDHNFLCRLISYDIAKMLKCLNMENGQLIIDMLLLLLLP